MKKILFSSILFTTILSADSFELFLQKAIQNSPYLKASSLDIEVQKEKSNKLLRYENPSVGVDYSRFNPNVGGDDDGYSVSISQPIRLWGVAKDKKLLSSTTIKSATLRQKRERAIFIRDISLAFIQYAKLKMLVDLGNDEQIIADKIYNISHERFKAGNIAKKEMLQALSSKQISGINKKTLELESVQKYYELLKIAGILEEIKLNINHNFKIADSKNQNIDMLLLQNQKKSSIASSNLAANKIEWINLNANFEKESEQDISTIGFSLPLALFDRKSQEKNIAKLKTKQTDLLIENKLQSLNLELKRLKVEREKLLLLKTQNENIIKTQERLLSMFEDGYKISKSNLLELQDVKNRVLESKKRLISLKTSLSQNAITTNYMQGAYNE